MLGRKRHVLVDTLGLLLNVDVHSAQVQDRDGAETLLRQARRRFPFIERIVGDGGYQGPKGRARGTDRLVEAGDRQAVRPAPLRGPVQALDRRTDPGPGLDQPQPSPVPGL